MHIIWFSFGSTGATTILFLYSVSVLFFWKGTRDNRQLIMWDRPLEPLRSEQRSLIGSQNGSHHSYRGSLRLNVSSTNRRSCGTTRRIQQASRHAAWRTHTQTRGLRWSHTAVDSSRLRFQARCARNVRAFFEIFSCATRARPDTVREHHVWPEARSLTYSDRNLRPN